jgi:hypothetical protein
MYGAIPSMHLHGVVPFLSLLIDSKFMQFLIFKVMVFINFISLNIHILQNYKMQTADIRKKYVFSHDKVRKTHILQVYSSVYYIEI